MSDKDNKNTDNKKEISNKTKNSLMLKAGLFTLIGFSAIGGLFIVTNKTNDKPVNPDTSNEENVPTDETQYDGSTKLEEYTEEGISKLRAEFISAEEMELGLNTIGLEFPNIAVNNISGEAIDFSSLKGKKTIIEISQDSCDFCKENAPILHESLKNYDDINLVSIFANSTIDGIDSYYKELGLEKPTTIGLDENKKLVNRLKLRMTPTLIYVDETGKISFISEGVETIESMNGNIETAFNGTKIYEMKK